MPITLMTKELLTVLEVTEITGHDRKYILKLVHYPEFSAKDFRFLLFEKEVINLIRPVPRSDYYSESEVDVFCTEKKCAPLL